MLNDTCDLWEDHKRSRCMNHVAMVAKLLELYKPCCCSLSIRPS